jgi:hypothetical protein
MWVRSPLSPQHGSITQPGRVLVLQTRSRWFKSICSYKEKRNVSTKEKI